MRSASEAAQQMVTLHEEGNLTEEAMDSVLRPLSKEVLSILADALEISLATKLLAQRPKDRNPAIWNAVKHRKKQVLAMAA